VAGRVQALGTRVRLSGPAEAELELSDDVRALWRDWTDRYLSATGSGGPGELLVLGRELFEWLDAGGWARAWAGQGGPRGLEIAADSPETADQRALLGLPWELLADGAGHLAADTVQPFVVWRRVGAQGALALAGHRDLSVLFMAAAPTGGGPELDFEAEESAILEATERLALGLAVEESGCAVFLRERLAGQESFEAIHLSCHGEVLTAEVAARFAGEGAEPGPALLLESPEGGMAFASPARLAQVWGGTPPGLVFLSACRTAESQQGMAESFARTLVRAVPAVLGWAGSVYDTDAVGFAEVFYRELAGFADPAYAVAAARAELLGRHLREPQAGLHWHLARLWFGPGGGGPLCARQQPRRRLSRDEGSRAFLDKAARRVPVAGASTFVGRRREAQQVLRAFRVDEAVGVLLGGMGNLGKSSLAARVANRLPGLTAVVVFEHYDPLKVLEQVVAALPPGQRRPMLEVWRPIVEADPTSLADALEELLGGPFFDAPILLVVDDVEQVLEVPAAGQVLTLVRVDNGWRAAVVAILQAFGRARGDSRLIVTSRYDFAATDQAGKDWAAGLVRVPLTPFGALQRAKQWRAELRTLSRAGRVDPGVLADPQLGELHRRALAAAHGNPGLQDILTRPVLAGEFAAASAAIDAIEEFLAGGDMPGEVNAAFEFFRRMTFRLYRDALTADELAMLGAAGFYGESRWPEQVDPGPLSGLQDAVVPVPRAAVEAVAGAAGVIDTVRAGDRLASLGLLDLYSPESGSGGVGGVAVNRFARPLAAGLDASQRHALAVVAAPALAQAWRDADGSWPADPRAVEASRVALLAGSADLAPPAALAAVGYLFEDVSTGGAAAAALTVGAAAVDLAVTSGVSVDLNLVRLLAEAAARIGAGGQRARLISLGLATPGGDPGARAMLETAEADRLVLTGKPDAALELLRPAAQTVEGLGDIRSRAVTMGRIADILAGRGESDEALRIRREEQLPVYERLGDVRERALTWGRIADILAGRGESDEALRIHREEQLPVFERLGDIRSRAVTMGRIADILAGRGESDEALRIHREEQLPVYERLGDVRFRAVAWGRIADILAGCGEADEALRIRREEELPVYEQLDDVRSRAITMGKIADILAGRGRSDEALQIYREEQLPVFERLGDVRERAIAWGRIADILARRGEANEALRIRREEQLPVYERLGDVRERAVAWGGIADILAGRGQSDEALRIRREEQLPVFERLDDVRSRAVTMGKIADILAGRGESDEALQIYREEQLPVFERLGDVRERAIAWGRIADILAGRGEADEALRIRREEELPVFERLGDVRERAVTLYKIGSALLEVGRAESGLTQEASDSLAEAFTIFERLKSPEGVARAGWLHSQILATQGRSVEALAVLDKTAHSFAQIGDSAAVKRCEELHSIIHDGSHRPPTPPTR
jgi:tetratricopeptide (TPR) repeat protein